ncbi:MAG: riboflavin biosynthesis protein RibF [Bacteroidales bacterium]|nr:riboflavin biosynthesis protein RibF [Bacteroidales bacterium]
MVVATGFFDGAHLGHRLVMEALVAEARRRGTRAVVVTFWPHPRTVLQNGARELRLLSTFEEKKKLLLDMGVDEVKVLEFSRELSSWSAEHYIRSVLMERYGADAIVIGYDNRLGSDGLGADELESLCRSLHVDVIRPGKALFRDEPISSTRIRRALQEGLVEDAAAMLGYDYSLHGVVVAGKQLGRTLGYPTANMQLYEPLKMLPSQGVYAVKVTTLGREWIGMCNVGPVVETHIFDFNEDIYGLDIKVSFSARIRDEIQFNSLDLLKEQLALDELSCRKYHER